MDKKNLFDHLFENIREKTKNESNNISCLQYICDILINNVSYYDWVGFYLVEGNDNIVLGPFAGEPTVHTKIKFGQGICGQAAKTKKIFIVTDVSKETNYLSCSPAVKSEIVLPIMKLKRIVGELDIDSYKISAFDENDRKFLNKVCSIAEKYF